MEHQHFKPTLNKFERPGIKKPRKPKSKGYTIVQFKKAHELYNSGKTPKEIGELLNMENMRVRDILQLPRVRNKPNKKGIIKIKDADKWWRL